MKLPSILANIFVSFILSYTLNAQVGISEQTQFNPDQNSILDVSSTNKGILIPRIALTDNTSISMLKNTSSATPSLIVFNTATAGTSPNNVTPGFYYWSGSKWVRLLNNENEAKPMVFYAPSIVLPTNSGTHTVDLYQEYYKQFGTPVLSANVDTTLITYTKEQLAYFITYKDDAVFTNATLANDGKFTYTVPTTPNITEKTFVNAVFKVRN